MLSNKINEQILGQPNNVTESWQVQQSLIVSDVYGCPYCITTLKKRGAAREREPSKHWRKEHLDLETLQILLWITLAMFWRKKLNGSHGRGCTANTLSTPWGDWFWLWPLVYWLLLAAAAMFYFAAVLHNFMSFSLLMPVVDLNALLNRQLWVQNAYHLDAPTFLIVI